MFQGIDLSSDTATKPTLAMRQAMMNAEVGDEQKSEDPTTRRLEEMIAEKLGFSAALFFPSATMANEIAITAFTERGDILFAAENCHLFVAEAGGPAIHANLMCRPIKTVNGIFSAEDLANTYQKPQSAHHPIPALISVENTTNLDGGVPWSKNQLQEIINFAEEKNLKKHMDGARFFNAHIATGLNPREITHGFDSVTICLSKGLGCPLGAILAFDKQYFDKIKRLKHMMGGAMRQSGMLAAAGIYALENHIDRLAEDHEHARLLANYLMEFSTHLQICNPMPASNMVFFDWTATDIAADDFLKILAPHGLRFSRITSKRFRAVTHLNISRQDIEKTAAILSTVLKSK